MKSEIKEENKYTYNLNVNDNKRLSADKVVSGQHVIENEHFETDRLPSRGNRSNQREGGSTKDVFNNQSNKAAVQEAQFARQEIDVLKIENQAQKDRVKEVRLNLQRQINELQELLKTQKDSHYTELSRLKLEYGKDLTNINRINKQREEQILIEQQQLRKQEQVELQTEYLQNSNKQKDDNEQQLKVYQQELNIIKSQKQQIEREFCKYKKESLANNFQGWGTFSIVFENKFKKLISFNSQYQYLAPNYHNRSQDQLDISQGSEEQEKKREELINERINHFIEVGFLIDSKNFLYLDQYQEITHIEANNNQILTKHLYEIQDEIENFKMLQFQNKIKSQFHENYALFNEINPAYISLNMGRYVNPFNDNYVAQENFKLIKREAQVIGSNSMILNFLKYSQQPDQFIIRVLAIENESCVQYAFDLYYEDLMQLVDGNMKFLEEEHLSDLCQIVLNNLTMITTKKISLQEYNVVSRSILAVEHKIFFSDHYRVEYDRNKLILAKNDKRKKGLLQDKSTEIDFQKSILYEANQIHYKECIKTFSDEINIILEIGNLSEHLILQIEISKYRLSQNLCLFSSQMSKSNQVQSLTSEIIKIDEHYQSDILAYVISLEKIFGLDSLVINITQLKKANTKDYKYEQIYLIKKNNREYSRINEFEILNTEIRSKLFMHSYGYYQSILDFGQLKAIQNYNIKDQVEKINLSSSQLIYREFGIVRIQINDNEQEDYVKVENQSALFIFYDDCSCINKGEILINIQVPLLSLNICQQLNFTHLISITDLNSNLKLLIDKIIIHQNSLQKFLIVIDKDIQPLSEVLQQIKSQKLKIIQDEKDIIDTELDQTQTIQLSQLVESPKVNLFSMFNRELFKITCYYVSNIKNIKIQTANNKKIFDWQILYIEAFSRRLNKTFTLLITEKDILEICNRVKEACLDQELNLEQILNAKSDNIIQFILDCIVFNENGQKLQISLNNLKDRIYDRNLMKKQFRKQGGHFIQITGINDDQDFSIYRTNLAQIELIKTLIINAEKDFHEKVYDIKIYEITLKNDQAYKKFYFEIFWVQNPQVIYRTEFFSDMNNKGKQMLLERFNIIQQMHQDFEENKFEKDSFVLTISESSFPRIINFYLFESISHIEWTYTINDNRLNQIETRLEKECQAKTIKEILQQGLLRTLDQDKANIIQIGYQKSNLVNSCQVDLWLGSIKSLVEDKNLVFGKNIQLSEQIFFEVLIYTYKELNIITLQIKNKQYYQIIYFNIECMRQSSKVLTGFIQIDTKQKLLYLVECSCSNTQQEKALRLTLIDPQQNLAVLNLIISERHLLDKNYKIKDECKYGLNTGYNDLQLLFQMIPEINNNFGKIFQEPKSQIDFKVTQDFSKTLYRKVIKSKDINLIILIKYESQELAEKQWKVILFYPDRNQEEEFIFLTNAILTKDEISQINPKNERIMKDLVARVAEKRLKIKPVDKLFEISKGSALRYMVYFNNPQNTVKNDNCLEFNIKNSYKFSLLNTQQMLPQCQQFIEEKLIVSLEKGNLIFDIVEILNPFSQIFNIKVFEKESLQQLTISEIKEFDLKRELMKDQKVFLLEPHRREELAIYLIHNIFFDSAKKRIIFLKTEFNE